MLMHMPPCQFPFGSLWSSALVPPKNQLQRPNLHDSCHQGHLPLVTVGLRQGQVRAEELILLKYILFNWFTKWWRCFTCSNISADDMLYTETDLEESMDKIETINFHEVKEVAGVKFWCYHAGHVLGAAMFMIEIAGVKVKKN